MGVATGLNALLNRAITGLLNIPAVGGLQLSVTAVFTTVAVLLAGIAYLTVSRLAKPTHINRVYQTVAVLALLVSFIPNALTIAGVLPPVPTFPGLSAVRPAAAGQAGQAADGAQGTSGRVQPAGGQGTFGGQRSANFVLNMEAALAALHVAAAGVSVALLTRAAKQ